MIFTIHRPIREQRFVVVLGSVAILGVVAFAASRNTETEPAEAIAAKTAVVSVAADSGAYWKSLQLLQDGFLPPAVAPAVTPEPVDYWQKLQLLQDNYLPPTENPAPAEHEANGLTDNRTNGPR